MRLVLIHGRSQGGKDKVALQNEWTGALARGFSAAGVTDPSGVDVRFPFYGDALDAQTKARRAEVSAVVERGDGSDDLVGELVAGTVDEMRKKAQITDAEIRAEIVATTGVATQEKGPANWEWVHAAGRLLSRRVPWLSEHVLTEFLADVDTYTLFPDEVDDIVRPEIDGDKAVVVGHSLGSVVGYRVLRDLGAAVTVPLYATLGSPLGITPLKRRLGSPLEIPRGVRAWYNGADERDPVALHARLDRATFCDGIENLSTLQNPRDNPHGIAGYLAQPEVAAKIAAALGSD